MGLNIELNGEAVQLPKGARVGAAVEAVGIETGDGRGFAVAVEGEVVPRSQWDTTELLEGQKVEVVGAVQGG